MTINQSDLDSFHQFATHLLGQAGQDLSLERMIAMWQAEREQKETIESIRRGLADAAAGRVQDLTDVDAKIRSELGSPARSR
jgi:predicted transcriptional regulator